jgi:D-sedoheptulose 7-phosphate isomerase
MSLNQEYIKTYLSGLQETITQLPTEKIEKIVDILLKCGERGSKVFMLGNGGSASTASHFACDLAKKYACSRRATIQSDCLN